MSDVQAAGPEPVAMQAAGLEPAAVRAADRRAVAGLAVAVASYGAAFGVLGTTAGIPVWLVVAMSVFVYAGGAQFAYVGAIAAGVPLPIAVSQALLINLRFVLFGAAIGHLFRGAGALGKGLAAHLMVDESVAMVATEDDERTARRLYRLTGLALVGAWSLGTAIGALAATRIPDPTALGLDAAFPTAFLALLVPYMDGRERMVAALAAAVATAATVPFLPAGIPLVVGILGGVAAARATGRRRV